MATPQPGPQDPLDALQALVNDVLIQTGKALRASRKDANGNAPSPHGSIQARLPETIKAFHLALDGLESDIIRAKSVLLRDLNELQSQKTQSKPAEQPQPSGPQSQSPTAIDFHPSPPAVPRDHPIKTEPIMKPVAPLADMGMSMPDVMQSVTAVREEHTPTQPSSSASAGGEFKVEGGSSSGPVGLVPIHQRPAADQADGHDSTGMNLGLNFTDMEFTLAPSNTDAQDQLDGNAAPETSFDLASFAPADSADNGHDDNGMASLDGIVPSNLDGPMDVPAPAANEGKPVNERSSDVPDSAFADIFTSDGQADGMDFDFSLGDGGMGSDTFDDLMNDRDNTFSTIEQGDFDATFFSLDQADGN